MSDARRPTWLALEADCGLGDVDSSRWVSVYTNLLTLLESGAAVSIGDRQSRELVTVDLDDVRQRLDFWLARLEVAPA